MCDRVRRVHILVLGDLGSGKTSFINRHKYDQFSVKTKEVIDQALPYRLFIDDINIELSLLESTGIEDISKHGRTLYSCVNVVILTFSADMMTSFIDKDTSSVGNDTSSVCTDMSSNDDASMTYDNELEVMLLRYLKVIRQYMAAIPIILMACKCDNEFIAKEEITSFESHAEEICSRMGMYYCKTSAKTGNGVQESIELAIRTLRSWEKHNFHRTATRLIKYQQKSKKPVSAFTLPPVIQENEKQLAAPNINILPSTFEEDFATSLTSGNHSDVTFINNNDVIQAHSVMLAAGSTVWRNVFMTDDSITQISSKRPHTHPRETPLIASCRCFCNSAGHHRWEIHLIPSIKQSTIRAALYYIYTGVLRKKAGVDLLDVLSLLTSMETQTSYTEESLTRSGFGHHLDIEYIQLRNQMLESFCCSASLSNLNFSIQGVLVPAHSGVVLSRCQGLSDVYTLVARDTQQICIDHVDIEIIKMLLTYFYTDDIDMDDIGADVFILMRLADDYGERRLVTLFERRLVDHLTDTLSARQSKIIDIAEELIDVYNGAKHCNADQLVHWCLHLFATHYDSIAHDKDFQQIFQEHPEYLAKYKWPPDTFRKREEDFKQHMKHINSCSVM